MGKYYKDRDDATGCLISFLFSVIIIGVLAWFAAIVLYYIFVGILTVSAIIGTIISLKNYIVALKSSILMHRYDAAPLNWKLPNFTYKWNKIVLDSIKASWKSNIYVLKTSFQQGLYVGFFSIRRCFYWLVGISVTLFGLVVSCGIVYVYIILLVALLVIMLTIIVLIASTTIIMTLVDSIKTLTCNFIVILKAQRKASCAINLSDYIRRWGYKAVKKMPHLLWRSTNKSFATSISTFRSSKILSVDKWFALGRILLIYPVTMILIPLIFIIEIIVHTILYLLFLFVT